MHSHVLRKLADSIAGLLAVALEKSWQSGEVSEDWRKVNVTPVFKMGKKEDPENFQPVSPTLTAGKMMECLILEAIFTHMDGKKVIRISQHGFSKGESCLTNLIAFHDGTTTWMDEGKAVAVVYLNFSEALNAVSHDILIGKFRERELNKWTVSWIENWLNPKLADPKELQPVAQGLVGGSSQIVSPKGQYWVKCC